jgi:hypothetical protein
MLTACKVPVKRGKPQPAPIVVIPVDRWSDITRQGIEFAARLSPEVIALHVEPNRALRIAQTDWEHYVEQPFREAGKEPPKLISAFALPLRHHSHRSVRSRSFEKNPGRSIIVVIPELVEDKWYEYFLHNQRGGFWNGCCWRAAMNASLR